MFDVIVVGGSYAGMAAALQLVRARKKVLIIDAGVRRNRFATHAHGILGQDGRAPGAIHADAKAQLLLYPDLTWLQDSAVSAQKSGHSFIILTAENGEQQARRLILATGVIDELPAIPGLSERWGRSVFHCPYCHGYELGQGHIGVLALGEISMHHALMLPDWGPTTFFTNGTFEPTTEQRDHLKKRHVALETQAVTQVTGERVTVNLHDGRAIELAGLFVVSRIHMASPLAEQLGCEFLDSPVGAVIKTNDLKETSIEGVFACGDAARAAGSITFAIADGAMAGLSAHRSLMSGV